MLKTLPKSQFKTVAGAGALVALLALLYYPILDLFFAADDWVFLYHVKDWQPADLWRSFQVEAPLFYRPLQVAFFALTYSFAKLNPLPYNLELLLLFLGVQGAAWALLALLFNRPLATVTVLLFSVSSMVYDLIQWKSNYAALQYMLLALLQAWAFAHYLRDNRKGWYLAALLAETLNLFAKESVVNTPLIMAVVWLTIYQEHTWSGDSPPLTFSWRRAAVQLLPFFAIAAAYALLHKLLFVNTYTRTALDYRLAPLALWPRQLLQGWSHTLFNYVYDSLVLPHLPPVRSGLIWIVKNTYILPIALIAAALYFKCREVLFAALISLALQVPTFILLHSAQNRYYYFPALGGSLLLAWVVVRYGGRIAEGGLAARIKGYAAICLGLALMAGDIVETQKQLSQSLLKSAFVEQAFQTVKRSSDSIPPDAIIVYCKLPDYFREGDIGLYEMTALATDREDLDGITSETLSVRRAAGLETTRPLLYLDVLTTQPALRSSPEATMAQ